MSTSGAKYYSIVRKFLARGFNLLILAVGSYLITAAKQNDHTDCPGDEVDIWFAQSNPILESFEYTASKTEQCYHQQRKLSAPPCLLAAQKYTEDFYFYSWKSIAAQNTGDLDLADTYRDKADQALTKSETEIDIVMNMYFNE